MRPVSHDAASLTRGPLLARNTLWSLLGQALPMVAAVLAIPLLVRGLGTERFGILTLTWTVIGYFSLFDFGLGRSLTQVVAERLGSGRTEELPALVWTSMFMILGLSVVVGTALAFATPWMAHRALHIPAALQPETIRAFYLLALTLPAVLGTAALGGVLAAHQRFGTLNALRIPLSVLSFVAPLAVLPTSQDLSRVVAVIAAVRFLGVFAHVWACARLMPEIRGRVHWEGRLAGPLMRSGGWIAVINVVGPIMVSLDRLLVGAWTSLAAVAYYATPQEVAAKLWAVPGPLANVLFPAFAASHLVDADRLRLLFFRGLKVVYCALFPVTLVIVVLGGDGLRMWLGAAFEQNSRLVLQILVVGAFLNGLSYVPSALVQAVGHSRGAALLLVCELPFYVLTLASLIRIWGIPGAAMAWLVRALVDLVGLIVLAGPSLGLGARLVRSLALPALGTTALLVSAFAVAQLGAPVRVGFLLVVLAGFACWVWQWGLADERRALVARIRRSK